MTRPQLFFRTADVTAAVTLNGREMVMPGDNAEVTCELIHPMPIEEPALWPLAPWLDLT